MKKFNIITSREREDSFLRRNLVESIPIYQSENGETTNPDDAIKTPLGQPIQIGYSKNTKPLEKKYNRITFNPANPEARLLAFECRTAMNNAVEPTVYMDKIEAANYINNSVTAFENNYKTLNISNNE